MQLSISIFRANIDTGSPFIIISFSQTKLTLFSASFSASAYTLTMVPAFSAANRSVPPTSTSAVTAAIIFLIFIVLLLYNIISLTAYITL